MNWSTEAAAAAVKDKKGVFWQKITCSYFQYLRASGGVDGNIWKMKGGLPKLKGEKERGMEKPPQAPLYLCSERKRVEILFKLD